MLEANVMIMLGKSDGLASERKQSRRPLCTHTLFLTLHVTVNFGLEVNLVVSVCSFNRVSQGLGVFKKYQIAD